MNRGNVLSSALAVLAIAGTASAQWSDNFDSYDKGTNLHGVGGWDGWDDDPGVAGDVTSDQARSGPHSIMISDGTGNDAVHPFTGFDSGQWTVTAYQYIPGNIDAQTFFIINNEYNHFGPYDWTIEMHMDPDTGLVNEAIHDPNGDNATPVIFDQWVELRVDFDLDNNFLEAYYNGELIASGDVNARINGLVEIQSIDLFGPHAVPQYFDDLSIQPTSGGCAADLDGDDDADADDFFAYLDAFAAGDFDVCDLDDDVDCDADDFFGYLDLFAQGC